LAAFVFILEGCIDETDTVFREARRLLMATDLAEAINGIKNRLAKLREFL
jgi:hypothetical protein